jgi:hypothetical protein
MGHYKNNGCPKDLHFLSITHKTSSLFLVFSCYKLFSDGMHAVKAVSLCDIKVCGVKKERTAHASVGVVAEKKGIASTI